jgi:hypothetical protein
MLGLVDSEDNNPSAATAVEEEGEENGILTSVSGGRSVDGGMSMNHLSWPKLTMMRMGLQFLCPTNWHRGARWKR